MIGAEQVSTVVCGVSCSRDLFERAVDRGAELVLVHHGLFWRNEPLVVDARLRGRLEALFGGAASLVAYHLSLDAHPTLGNNAQLAARLGAMPVRPFGTVGRGYTIDSLSLEALATRVEEVVERPRSSCAAASTRCIVSRCRRALPATTSSRRRTTGTTPS